MNAKLNKKLCQSLLKEGMISEDSAQSFKHFQNIIDDIVRSFPKYKSTDPHTYNDLKKRFGRMLSAKAKQMNVDQKILKKVKQVVFNAINVKLALKIKKPIRKLKIGKNRQIYSSEEETSVVKLKLEENCGEIQQTDTQSIPRPIVQKQQIIAQKRKDKYKKRKYIIYDQDFKESVCQMASQKGIDVACKTFNLSTRKINGWLEAYNLDLLGKGRKALDPVMEFHMCIWILKKIWQQIPLTQKIIRQKSVHMTTNGSKFNGSKGWLQKFFLRHVELKSCFDSRTRECQKEQCAKYHRSGFTRLLKDYQSLQKLGVGHKLIKGDFEKIIYENGSHPLLKLAQDKYLDKYKTEDGTLYDYEILKNMAFPDIKIEQDSFIDKVPARKNQQVYDSDTESEQEYEDTSEQDQEEPDEIIMKDEEMDSQQNAGQIDIYEEEDDDEPKIQPQSKVKVEDIE